jgi:hypothetical protein
MRDVTIMGLLFSGDDNLQSGFDSAKEKRKSYGLRRPGMQLEEEGRILEAWLFVIITTKRFKHNSSLCFVIKPALLAKCLS